MKKKETVAEVARDLLLNDNEYNYLNCVAYGDIGIIYEIFVRAGLKVKIPHPLNREQAVLNALDKHCKTKNPLFYKWHFRSYKGLARVFYLIEKDDRYSARVQKK